MKIEKTQVFNLEGAIRGMRNPMDSWDKSDSGWGCYDGASPVCKTISGLCSVPEFVIGPEDMKLATRLIIGGTEHRKFLRQIFVCMDITAPRYWWQEFDTYKVGTVANSCSTMHKLKDYPFSLDMFEIDPGQIDDDWHYTINMLEKLRQKYNETKSIVDFRNLKQRLPESFLQKRTITLNYENIITILNQRGNHRLFEWSRIFAEWTMNLPYMKDFWRITQM